MDSGSQSVTVKSTAEDEQTVNANVADIMQIEISAIAFDFDGVMVDLMGTYGDGTYADAGGVARSDGGRDLAIGIEDVLGTAYDGLGQDLENYLAAGGRRRGLRYGRR